MRGRGASTLSDPSPVARVAESGTRTRSGIGRPSRALWVRIPPRALVRVCPSESCITKIGALEPRPKAGFREPRGFITVSIGSPFASPPPDRSTTVKSSSSCPLYPRVGHSGTHLSTPLHSDPLPPLHAESLHRVVPSSTSPLAISDWQESLASLGGNPEFSPLSERQRERAPSGLPSVESRIANCELQR